jgi:hypothetical protein
VPRNHGRHRGPPRPSDFAGPSENLLIYLKIIQYL